MKPKAPLHLLLLSALCASSLKAQDCGTWGTLFPIQEESLLEVIQGKLQHLEETGRLQSLQQAWRDKAKARLESPEPVSKITKATHARTWGFDPSITLTHDLKDQQGRLFYKKGEKINPLSKVSLTEPLLFIDGDDDTQVTWALQEKGKIILVKGRPFQLMDTHNRRFYFDQGGLLTRKLGLTALPTRVTQEGLRLKIEEVAL